MDNQKTDDLNSGDLYAKEPYLMDNELLGAERLPADGMDATPEIRSEELATNKLSDASAKTEDDQFQKSSQLISTNPFFVQETRLTPADGIESPFERGTPDTPDEPVDDLPDFLNKPTRVDLREDSPMTQSFHQDMSSDGNPFDQKEELTALSPDLLQLQSSPFEGVPAMEYQSPAMTQSFHQDVPAAGNPFEMERVTAVSPNLLQQGQQSSPTAATQDPLTQINHETPYDELVLSPRSPAVTSEHVTDLVSGIPVDSSHGRTISSPFAFDEQPAAAEPHLFTMDEQPERSPVQSAKSPEPAYPHSPVVQEQPAMYPESPVPFSLPSEQPATDLVLQDHNSVIPTEKSFTNPFALSAEDPFDVPLPISDEHNFPPALPPILPTALPEPQPELASNFLSDLERDIVSSENVDEFNYPVAVSEVKSEPEPLSEGLIERPMVSKRAYTVGEDDEPPKLLSSSFDGPETEVIVGSVSPVMEQSPPRIELTTEPVNITEELIKVVDAAAAPVDVQPAAKKPTVSKAKAKPTTAASKTAPKTASKPANTTPKLTATTKSSTSTTKPAAARRPASATASVTTASTKPTKPAVVPATSKPKSASTSTRVPSNKVSVPPTTKSTTAAPARKAPVPPAPRPARSVAPALSQGKPSSNGSVTNKRVTTDAKQAKEQTNKEILSNKAPTTRPTSAAPRKALSTSTAARPATAATTKSAPRVGNVPSKTATTTKPRAPLLPSSRTTSTTAARRPGSAPAAPKAKPKPAEKQSADENNKIIMGNKMSNGATDSPKEVTAAE